MRDHGKPGIPGLTLAAMGRLVLPLVPVLVLAGQAPSGTNHLGFDPAKFTTQSTVLAGRTITYRAYEGLVYVEHPVDPQFQNLNIYVPVEYYEGKAVGDYRAGTAPIFFPNSVGGFMPSRAAKPRMDARGHGNAVLIALSRGCVVAAPATRGRTNVDAAGNFTGKAPAAIIDLKAAVRYLRANAGRMPGMTERIVSNGTSAGGCLSALLGASGNCKDYEPYLKALGAAQARDDVFAVSAYCPIADLDHADLAYEWQFSGMAINPRNGMQGPPPGSAPGGGTPPEGLGPRPEPMKPVPPTAKQIEGSEAMKAAFPAYVNGLGLKAPAGKPLTLDADGGGPFKEHLASLVQASAQRALDAGRDLSDLTWVHIRSGKVTDLDLDGAFRAMGRMKPFSAFDGLEQETPENSLFGTETLNAQHFTEAGRRLGSSGGSLADLRTVRLMNPMAFIGSDGATVARHWRIRHGTADPHTSLAVPALLAAKVENTGAKVDLAFPWAQGHGGDYDLDELFAWIDQACQ